MPRLGTGSDKDMGKKVAVMVVDDSVICQQLISDALNKDPSLEVVGTCFNGQEALDQMSTLRPDVITMDVDMPVMDGLSAVERIMARFPVPILMLTADPRYQTPEETCKALELGALALQIKPAIDAGPEAWNLAREVKLLSSVKVIRHLKGAQRRGAMLPPPTTPVIQGDRACPVGIVAVAASTGGPQVLHRMLSALPADFPVPIVVVQHINAAFSESLAGWLAKSSRLQVKLAEDGETLKPGQVLIAPSGQHLVVAFRGRVALQPGVERDGHMPSGTVLLESAARVYGPRTLGVILTGMGADGADGMLAVRSHGGKTLAQSEDSCVVFGMPGAAVARRAVEHLVHGDDMAAALMRAVRGEPLVTPR